MYVTRVYLTLFARLSSSHSGVPDPPEKYFADEFGVDSAKVKSSRGATNRASFFQSISRIEKAENHEIVKLTETLVRKVIPDRSGTSCVRYNCEYNCALLTYEGKKRTAIGSRHSVKERVNLLETVSRINVAFPSRFPERLLSVRSTYFFYYRIFF